MGNEEFAMRIVLISAAIILAGASAAPAFASEAVPAALAKRLDGVPAEFTMSDAKRERLMIIQENLAAQQGYGRRPPGYGPPPAYGPPPRYGYGYGRGYGPPRGYDAPPPPPPGWW